MASELDLGTQWGMISFLASEAAFFATLIVAYLIFLGKDKVGPDAVGGTLPASGLVHDALASCPAA